MAALRQIAAEVGGISRGLPDEVLTALAHLVADMRFGSIEITVHEGRITQLERRERIRVGLGSVNGSR